MRPSSTLSRYLTPWRFRRDETEQRLIALRTRDGDDCRRCRRAIQFDLPAGHDRAPAVERIAPDGGNGSIDNLCLCHVRCFVSGADHTSEVTDRVRRKSEAALLSRQRR